MIRTLRRWRNQPDHYYWITATLAARGFQRATRRLVVLLVMLRAAVAVLMIWSPVGPRGALGESATLAVCASCLVVAACWSRRRWPTRVESLVVVAVLALGICAASLTRSDQVSAVLVCMLFAALTAYIVFFHTVRYLLPLFILGAATALVPIVRIAGSGDVARALCLVVSAAIVALTVTAVTQMLVHLLGIRVLLNEIEPVTGLLNRAAFVDATGAFIASRSRLDDRQLVLIVARLDQLPIVLQSSGPVAGERTRVAMGQLLREDTRNDAVVAHVDGTDFLIADSFTEPDAGPLLDRLRGGVRTALRMTLSVGVVCTPMRGLAACAPAGLVDELVSLASAAARDAARSGGNTVKYMMCERPAALDDHPDQFGLEDLR